MTTSKELLDEFLSGVERVVPLSTLRVARL